MMTAAPAPRFAAIWLRAGPGHEWHCLERFYLAGGAPALRDPLDTAAGYRALAAQNCPAAELRLVWRAEAPPPFTCGPPPAD